jgi:hypothetical protein
MKTAIALTTLALLVAPAWAHDKDSSPEEKQGIRNVHDSHFPHTAGDSHAPAQGSGESYGSISPMGSPEIQIIIRGVHVPNPSYTHTHGPEKGQGDDYGQVLKDVDVPKK